MTAIDTKVIHEKAGPQTAAEAIAWTNTQIPYVNRASDRRTHDRVLGFVKDLITPYQGAIRPMHLRWRVLDLMLAGNAVEKNQIDTHIPELYKAREAAVPRIEGAILDMDPFFKMRPRQPTSRNVAEANAALINWQLDQAAIRSLIPALIEDLWTYQVCVAKVSWERRYLERIQREVSSKVSGSDVETTIKRTRVNNVVFDGPQAKIVNPYRFLVDPCCTSIATGTFVGDQSDWTFHDLKRYEELGLFANVDKLKDDEAEGMSGSAKDMGMADYLRYAQSPTSRYQQAVAQTPSKVNRKYSVNEVWCRFDLYDDGIERECVLTVADGRVVLRAMENPLDGKRKPYAVARAARTGHSFFGTGPMDNAVRLQIDYDRYSAIALRIAKLIANPIVFTELDSDLPNSLHLLPEGAIIPGAGKVDMVRMPNTLDLISFVFGHYEKQIAETTGVPKTLEGTPTGGTATEVNRLALEANRRLQGIERRFGEFMRDLISLFHDLNLQFMTQKTAFPVLGKRSRYLGHYSEIGPETLLKDVDVEIVGLDNLQSYGIKATALQNILVGGMPLIQTHMNNVDTLQWLHEMVEASLGADIAGRLVKVPRDPSEYMTQQEENIELARGFVVQVDAEDDHQQHLDELVPLLQKLGSFPEIVQDAVKRHERDHMVAIERQKIQQRLLAERQEAQAASMPQGQEDGDVMSPPPGGMESTPGKTKGENPGPQSQGKTPRPGRKPNKNQGDDDR